MPGHHANSINPSLCVRVCVWGPCGEGMSSQEQAEEGSEA